MQSASPEFESAMDGTVTWVPPKLRADWWLDGMVPKTIVASDKFSRTVSNGWGPADSGQAWNAIEGPISEFSTDGTLGLQSSSATNVSHSMVLPLNTRDMDIRIDVSHNVGSVTGGNLQAFFDARMVDTLNLYRMRIRWEPATNTATAELVRVLGGTPTTMVSKMNIPGTTSTSALTVRLQVSGTVETGVLVRGKVWLAGQPEPADWMVSGIDDTMDDPGDFRAASYREGGNTNNPTVFRFDNLTVIKDKDQAEISALSVSVVDRFGRSGTNGWGRTETGEEWVVDNGPTSSFWTEDGSGIIALDTVGVVRNVQIPSRSHHAAIDVRARFKTDVLAAGQNIYAYLETMINGTDLYRARMNFQPDQQIGLRLQRQSGSTAVTVGGGSGITLSGIAHAAGSWYWLRFRYADGVLKTKIWLENTPQPDWQLVAEDNTWPGITGAVGVRGYLEPGNTNTLPVKLYVTDFLAVDPSIDDLSSQTGETFTVEHSMDDGLPDSITSNKSGVPVMSAGLTGRDGMNPRQYFSPFNSSSPVADNDRDVAPVELDHGLITSNGEERVRVFTGQMVNVPLEGESASLVATSKARLAMSASGRPPIVWGSQSGANGTWLISWALWLAGLPLSPPPAEGTRLWAPLHGSMVPFLPGENTHQQIFAKNSLTHLLPTSVPGPFSLAMYAQYDTYNAPVQILYPKFGPGEDYVTATHNKGRLEFWVRGDTHLVTGSGNIMWASMLGKSTDEMWDLGVQFGIRRSDRKLEFHVWEPYVGSIRTFTSTVAVPTDGNWHHVGFAWDLSGNRLWMKVDTTVEAVTPSPVINLAEYPDIQIPGLPTVLQWWLPVAEVHFVTGPNARPDGSSWRDQVAFASKAHVIPSKVELQNVVEDSASDAWDLIARVARAELAAMRLDENDEFWYMPPDHFAQAPQQTVQGVVSTDTNAGTPEVTIDPTKVRNRVTVKFQEALVDAKEFQVVRVADPITLPKGTTVITFTPDRKLLYVDDDYPFSLLNAAQRAGTPVPTYPAYLAVNTLVDGTGVYEEDTNNIEVKVLSWQTDEITLQFVNRTGGTRYVVHNGSNDVPFLSLMGRGVTFRDAYSTASDQGSIKIRGIRSLEVEIPIIQDRITAAKAASSILGVTTGSQEEIVVEVYGDPRRQPGDLVTFEDKGRTEAKGRWRIQAIQHNRNGAHYTQILSLRKAKTIMVWDEFLWDEALWGE